jgi:hypothetical protein
LQDLQTRQFSLLGELAEINTGRANLLEAVRKTSDGRIRGLYEGELIKLLDAEDSVKKLANEVQNEINSLRNIKDGARERVENVRQLINYMGKLKNKNDEEALAEVRMRLSESFRNLIDHIEVFPVGGRSDAVQALETASITLPAPASAVSGVHTVEGLPFRTKYRIKGKGKNAAKRGRHFLIHFKGGALRLIYPEAVTLEGTTFSPNNWHYDPGNDNIPFLRPIADHGESAL